jgi:hypothetical protein
MLCHFNNHKTPLHFRKPEFSPLHSLSSCQIWVGIEDTRSLQFAHVAFRHKLIGPEQALQARASPHSQTSNRHTELQECDFIALFQPLGASADRRAPGSSWSVRTRGREELRGSQYLCYPTSLRAFSHADSIDPGRPCAGRGQLHEQNPRLTLRSY